MSTMGIDEAKLEAFMGQAVTDMGAIISAPLMVIGEKLGLYKAMAHAGPLTAAEVAERAGAAERSVREWLGNQAAGGYVTYDPESDRYTLPDEHALALADEDSPFYILGVYDSIASLYADEDRILEAFKSGGGMGWHEHDHRLFRGTERFFRPGYRAHLVGEWIPALEGVQEKLEARRQGRRRRLRPRRLDDHHGRGVPQLRVLRLRLPRAVDRARARRPPGRPAWRTASPSRSPPPRTSPARATTSCACSTACTTWAIPVGAARHVHESLADDGTWMIVEPFAGDSVEENLNPVGRVFYGASTMICTPASLAQEVGLALGAQAGEARLTEVLERGRLHARAPRRPRRPST